VEVLEVKGFFVACVRGLRIVGLKAHDLADFLASRVYCTSPVRQADTAEKERPSGGSVIR
jgi:hypothetical protein